MQVSVNIVVSVQSSCLVSSVPQVFVVMVDSLLEYLLVSLSHKTAGISTNTPVGVNTSTVDDNDLTGIGNSFKGLYVANGMVITDKELTGVHYIGTNFSSVMGTSHHWWNSDR